MEAQLAGHGSLLHECGIHAQHRDRGLSHDARGAAALFQIDALAKTIALMQQTDGLVAPPHFGIAEHDYQKAVIQCTFDDDMFLDSMGLPAAGVQHFIYLRIGEILKEAQPAQHVEALLLDHFFRELVECAYCTGQIGGEFYSSLVAPGRILLQRLVDDVLQHGRHIRTQAMHRRRRSIYDLMHQPRHVVAVERSLASEQLVHHHAYGIEVSLRGGRLLAHLLRRHIAR